jgi:ABC-type antimicrobial peptide transport system permease subunit
MLRRAEIGVRMALGARVQQVWRMIVAQSVALAATGIAIGLVATLLANDILRALLFQVSPRDPVVLAGAAIVLLLAALAASYLPAQRAARTSAAESLRAD